jgi:hypothetical protein
MQDRRSPELFDGEIEESRDGSLGARGGRESRNAGQLRRRSRPSTEETSFPGATRWHGLPEPNRLRAGSSLPRPPRAWSSGYRRSPAFLISRVGGDVARPDGAFFSAPSAVAVSAFYLSRLEAIVSDGAFGSPAGPPRRLPDRLAATAPDLSAPLFQRAAALAQAVTARPWQSFAGWTATHGGSRGLGLILRIGSPAAGASGTEPSIDRGDM